MAGGPLYPYSVTPITAGSNIWGPESFLGDGANAQREKTHVTVKASLGANATIHLGFEAPPELPTGTAKLRVVALCDVETGAVKFNVNWASVAVEEDPSAATMNAEGTQTITWASADDDVYKELKLTLNADTVVLSEFITMQIQFNTTDWTVVQHAYFIFTIIWE